MRLIRLVNYETRKTIPTIHLGVSDDGAMRTACGMRYIAGEGVGWRRVRGDGHVVTCQNCEQTNKYREFYNQPKPVDPRTRVVKAAETLVDFWRMGYGYHEEDLYPAEMELLDSVRALNPD